MLQAQPPTPGQRARIAVGIRNAEPAAAAPVDLVVADLLQAAASESGGTGVASWNTDSAGGLLSSRRPAISGRSTASEIAVTPPPGALRRSARGTGALLERRIRPATEVFAHISSGRETAADLEPTAPAEAPLEDQRDPTRAPLFGQLIRQGIRPKRARLLAEASLHYGIQDAVQMLAEYLPPKTTGRAPSRVLFTGEAGAGKTALVLRSALSRIRAGRRAPSIVVVAPRTSDLRGWQDPTSMFESFDLHVVRCSREALPSALAALDGEVLIDTPAGFRVPKGLDAHVRQVIDARAAGSGSTSDREVSDSVILTHIDSASTLGYVTERLIEMNIPVSALVRSGQPEGHLEPYSPKAFAATVCHV
ncbi:MAG: hypothetical protein ACI9W4_000115 [Rhodothermales bacterium]|jgi:hypothetical protein